MEFISARAVFSECVGRQPNKQQTERVACRQVEGGKDGVTYRKRQAAKIAGGKDIIRQIAVRTESQTVRRDGDSKW